MSKRKNKHIGASVQKAEPVFIHSLWRTGSTYLFSVFRRSASGYWCYQEPIHEIALYSKECPEILNSNVIVSPEVLRHPFLDKPYFQELFMVWPTWCDDMKKHIIYDAYFGEADNNITVKYLDKLINCSKGRPVIQECRTSNRVTTLKQAFGGQHIYLWRNPWDQWWSYKATSYFDITSQLILNTIVHPESITRIRQEIGFKEFHHEDISKEFEHFDQIRLSAQDSYLVFYLLWCLGLMGGVSHSDLLISIDSLSDSVKYQNETCDSLSALGIGGVDFSDCAVYQNHFTDQEKIFFASLEDRVHGLLLVSGYSQHHIDELLELRRIHKPKACLTSLEVVKPEALRADAERAREIVIRNETTYSKQLLSVRDELSRQFMDAEARESVLTKQIDQKHQQFTQLFGDFAAQEKEFGEQSLQAKEAAEQEKAELLQAYVNKEELLRKDFLTREDSLRQELVNLLGTLAAREKEFGEQSLQAKVTAEQEKAGLLRQYTEQEQTLKREQIQREDSLHNEQRLHIQALQQQFSDTFDHLQLQHEQYRQVTITFEEHLKQQIWEELQAGVRLHQSLDVLKREMDAIHSSFSWRFTAPLRSLARLFGTAKPIMASYSETDPTSENAINIQTVETPNQQFEHKQIKMPLENECMLANTFDNNISAAKTIDELLSYHDKQFVSCSYLTLLGRKADPEGMSYYLGRLRAGYGKAKVITQLAESAEAKIIGTELAGLRELVLAQKKADHWFWGFFSRGRRIERQTNRLEYELGRFAQKVHHYHVESSSRFEQLEQAMGKRLVSINDMAVDIDKKSGTNEVLKAGYQKCQVSHQGQLDIEVLTQRIREEVKNIKQ